MALDIMLPFWGDPELLRTTVRSVLAQKNPDWLLTVVDDAYPDDTVGPWLEALGDDRVTYHRHAANVGITANYQSCIDLATQDLMMFLGCDDLMDPGFVDVVLTAAAEVPEAAVIQPGVRVVDEHGARVRPLVDVVKQRIAQPSTTERTLLSGEDLAASVLVGNWLYWPSLVFRRAELERFEFREGFPIIQDLALIVDMAHGGCSLLFEPATCFSYRRHTASASAASLLDGSRFEADRRYFAIAAEQARAAGWRRAERAARRRWLSRAHALSLLPGAVGRGGSSAFRQLLAHALRR